jgi:Protein of unknown function (DUF2961)
MNMIRRFSLLLLLVSATIPADAQRPTYTYPQLVDRLTNLELLAKLPAPGEKTALASSYDRSSQYDAATDKYINWSANGDAGGYVRQEGDTVVLMDVKGPGVIWRMWAANRYADHVRIYLDGATTPTIDLPSSSYFDGSTPPFNRPNLVYSPLDPRGLDNYIPISFNNGCKIVADKDWRHYFHFNYTLFPAGTTLPTFTMNLSPADNLALDRANRILGDSGHAPPSETSSKAQKISVLAQPNAAETVADFKGTGAITAIKVKLDLPKDAEAQRILLRQLTLSITWDNESTPAVWSPLGDFFAYVGGADVFQSYPVGLLEDGTFYAYWYMPYGRHAHIAVGNDGPAPIRMLWEIDHAPLHGHIQDFARFHAKWHRNAFLPTRPDRSAIDWTLLTTTGTGRFIGTHLHGWNPRGAWWGEGDEKFFIDGEKFPSTFGTGSEDYFGYAYSSAGHFSRPYHNQILNEANAGHFDDNRWHISDSLPFQTSFEGDIEKYFLDERTTLYAAEVFWYLKPGGVDPYEPTSINDRAGYWIRPKMYQEPGVIEAETLGFDPPLPPGLLQRVDMYHTGKEWSSDRQLIWSAAKPGDTLSLWLPLQKAGAYRLIVRFTDDATSGIFQLLINDQPIGQPIDLYSPVLKAADPIDLGIVTIPDGQPIMKITSTGKNSASTNLNFGFDYLKLIPIP